MSTEPTAKVIVRHSLTCPDRKKGSDWRRCNCRKSLLLYDGVTRKNGKLTNRLVSAKTRSWDRAEKAARDWLDSFDPEKQELKHLRAEKERQQVRLEEAVALYCADTIRRLGDNGTVRMIRSLLGYIDSETKQLKSSGHFFSWLGQQVPRPVFVADITPTHLTAWRATWSFGSDLTAAQRWGMVKGFFSFCESQGWIADSPARKLKPLKIAQGNRTTAFTDKQYTAIHDAIFGSAPENVPAETRKNWEQRLETFLELLRWSGMDVVDAVQFTPNTMDADGVLRYRRQKTDILATVPLPEHVVTLLRSVPLERDSIGPSQPFRTNVTMYSDVRCWQHRLEHLFTLAGITEVKTDLRTRKPHVKMLRDTFAVWHLRHGASLHTVAKMMGHTKTATTEKSYLPWVKELDQAHIADARQALKHIPRPKAGVKVTVISRAK